MQIYWYFYIILEANEKLKLDLEVFKDLLKKVVFEAVLYVLIFQLNKKCSLLKN